MGIAGIAGNASRGGLERRRSWTANTKSDWAIFAIESGRIATGICPIRSGRVAFGTEVEIGMPGTSGTPGTSGMGEEPVIL